MTDNEIIKAFECCYLYDVMFCDKCPNKDTCGEIDIAESILDLINRQQKQINELVERHLNHEESVKKAKEACYQCQKRHKEELKTAKSEAYKEFSERLNKRMGFCDLPNVVVRGHIDNLLKEMGVRV